jgi:uncharacterized 2Fe-2S/4Fe-4S cluster protein (DUF4445 family)
MIKVPEKVNILDYLRSKSYPIIAPCNGIGKCGKCKIKVLDQLLAPTSEEIFLLEEKEIKQNIRLACCHKTTTETTIELIDIERKMDIISDIYLPHLNGSNITSRNGQIYRDNELIALGSRALGVAIDIGTTTCVVALCDLLNKAIVSVKSFINPQTSYGHDVISRIAYASSQSGLEHLQKLIIDEIQEALNIMLSESSLSSSTIYEIVIAGNATMNHLFLGINPSKMAYAPYTPTILEQINIKADKIFNQTFDKAMIRVFPSIDAFVGGDIVSGIYALNLQKSSAVSLFIDLGTNGEMVLKNGNQIYVTSTAVGPAFEGINITCGTGAIEGALSAFSMKDVNVFDYETIQNKPLKNICGSGLIDIVSELFKFGHISKSGYMKEPFHLDSNTYLSPKDVRQVQLAKSAIRAGIETLINYANVSVSKIEKVYIAGGFGQHINIQNVVNIGLLPKELENRVLAVGNTCSRWIAKH